MVSTPTPYEGAITVLNVFKFLIKKMVSLKSKTNLLLLNFTFFRSSYSPFSRVIS
jgi:hypothetical protein